MERDVILIPGFWLEASSWHEVLEGLRLHGVHARAMSLPGMASREDDRDGIGLDDWVSAVVAEVDASEHPVVLVGHSAGGAVSHAVSDRRPERVARVVYVDSLPMAEGQCVNDELPVVDGAVPLPDWSLFPDEDLVDLDEGLRETMRERAIPVPVGAAHDPQHLTDERRHDVPSTVVACEFTRENVREWLDDAAPWTVELAALCDLEIVELPTGHWPQFTRPSDLAEAIAGAILRP